MTESLGRKNLSAAEKSKGGRLVSSDETSAWQVSSVQGSAYLDDRKLRAKYFLLAEKNSAGNSHPMRMRPICRWQCTPA